MKNREEYNEVYGWLPQDVINNLSEIDKKKMFVEWVLRKPTATGWFITRTVVAAAGDGFIEYIFQGLTEALEEDGEEVTRENLVSSLSTLLEMFSTDTNILAEYLRSYRTEVLGLDDQDLDPDEESSESEVEESKLPKRDSKGRFIKKK